ncbi:MAG TPA: ABC transporter permease [Acidimicrobiia bacterium]|nr:ABC transporter permease [Acidimicrobiia bacterium]
MTATPAPTAPAPLATRESRGRGGALLLPAVMRSEWTKLRSVRSTIWSLFATFVITVGFGALFCLAYVSRYDRLGLRERLTFDPTAQSLRGIFLAQLAIGVLGVLVISAEYATGLIRPTLTAVPQRRTVLAAKAIVFGVVALVVTEVGVFAAFAAGQAVLAGKNLGVGIGDPHVLRAVLGAGVYLTIIGLLGLALATIIRRTAGAIATLVGLVLIAPLLAQALPSPWNSDVTKFLPTGVSTGLGAALFGVRPDSSRFSPGVALLLLVAWVVVGFAVAAFTISRRDA